MPNTREIAGRASSDGRDAPGGLHAEEASARIRGWLKNRAPKERHNIAQGASPGLKAPFFSPSVLSPALRPGAWLKLWSVSDLRAAGRTGCPAERDGMRVSNQGLPLS